MCTSQRPRRSSVVPEARDLGPGELGPSGLLAPSSRLSLQLSCFCTALNSVLGSLLTSLSALSRGPMVEAPSIADDEFWLRALELVERRG